MTAVTDSAEATGENESPTSEAIDLRVLVQQLRAPNLTAQGRASEWRREHGLDLDLIASINETQSSILPILRTPHRAG